MTQETISVTIEEQKVDVTVLTPTFIQVNLLQPVVLDSVTANTNHREGDGSDHTDVALNNTHRGRIDNPHVVTKAQVGLGNVTDDSQLKRSAGDFQAFTQKITPAAGDSVIIEDGSDGQNKKRVLIDSFLGGGGGILELQSTATINNDTYIEFSLVPGKRNFFFYENVLHGLVKRPLVRLSNNNGVSFLTSNYKWFTRTVNSGAAVSNIQNDSSGWIDSNCDPINNQPDAAINGFVNTTPPIAGNQIVIEGHMNCIFNTSFQRPLVSDFGGSNATTSIITHIQFSGSLSAGGMVSGKIHHYVENLG